MSNRPSDLVGNMRRDAVSIFNAAIKAADPSTAVKNCVKREKNWLFIQGDSIDLSRVERIYVVGAGKASVSMAKGLEDILSDRIREGVICAPYGNKERLRCIPVVEAGHPVPDEIGRTVAHEILALATSATEKDLIFCLISGGGSALIPLPSSEITLKEKQFMTRTLLSCGAAIHEINTLRKHLSMIKGGLLARAAYPAEMITLLVSDVVGDRPDVIASGPTVADTSRFEDCLRIIKKYHIANRLPEAVWTRLLAGANGAIPETPKPGDSCFIKVRTHIIGSNRGALLAAKTVAESFGYNTLILSSMMEGETREAARFHTAVAKEIVGSGNPVCRPACLLSGGETTVTIQGNGKGGRNQEFVLAASLDISGVNDIVVFSAGTDGIDGFTDAAGAVADSDTCTRAEAFDLDPKHHLLENDAYPFFQKLNDLIITGPTHTNVMDIRIVLVG